MAVYISPIASITPQICSEQATRQSTTTTISERPKMRTPWWGAEDGGSLFPNKGVVSASIECWAMKKLILTIIAAGALTSAPAQLFSPEALNGVLLGTCQQIPDAPRVPDAPTI